MSVEVIDHTAPSFSAICHCKNCRDISGTPYFWGNGWQPAQLKISGETISYTHEVNHRHSCSQCGAMVYEECPPFGIVMLPAARLQSPAPPAMHVFVRDKVYPLPEDGLPRFETMPPMG